MAAVAEAVALACVRTVAGDKEFFLGEFSTSYLSAARLDVRKFPLLHASLQNLASSISTIFCHFDGEMWTG